MRSIHLLAIYVTAGLVLSGCSSGSGLRNAGGATSTTRAAGSGQSSTAGGGTQSSGGSSTIPASGGSTLVTRSPAGGRAGGGSSSTAVVGGSSKTGGSSATAGTGGQSTRAMGGSSAGAGGASTSVGDSIRGGTSGGSITSSSRSSDAGVVDGGIVASGYCEGNAAKLTTQGQTVTPGVTDYESNVAMGCCNGYGVNLHSTAALGFDVAIELILSINIFTPNEYDVGGASSIKARALVFKSSDPLTTVGTVNSQGKLRVFGADGSVGLAEFGLCLEVTDATSPLAGTRIHVPRVIIGSYQSNQRFQIFLLKDSSLRVGAVSALPLDSLVLADSPVLDLGRIAYVEKATTKMGFNPGQKVGENLRTSLGTPLNMPFVVVADGARIYLGTFTSVISSISPVGPFVEVEDITADGLTLRAPIAGTDPRNDERIINALNERGKLVP